MPGNEKHLDSYMRKIEGEDRKKLDEFMRLTGAAPIDMKEFDLIQMAVIRPAQSGQRWDENVLFDLLENFTRDAGPYLALVPMLVGKIHLLDQITTLSERLSSLMILYIKRLSMPQTDPTQRIFLLGWAFELINTVLAAAHDRHGMQRWISSHKAELDSAFASGVVQLKEDAKKIMATGANYGPFANALDELVRDIARVK